jgi:amidase
VTSPAPLGAPSGAGEAGLPSVWREHGTPLVPPLSPGLLAGIRVAVKDLFAVAGFAVGAGNPRWLEQAGIEPVDAWAVRSLRAAGASIAGIARTDELAFSLSGSNAHYGTPPNPAAPDRVTGGSTSGPAAAVAAGQAEVGLGTDTAGSIRVPASACGLYGLRPTYGAVPFDGVLHLAPSFDAVGWLTADPHVLRGVGSVLLPAVPASMPDRLVCFEPAGEGIHGLAEKLGTDLRIGPVAGLDDLDELLAAFRTVQTAEAWRVHGRWVTANPGALAVDVEARFRVGSVVDAEALRQASTVITTRRARLLDALDERSWLVLPAAAGPGHLRDADAAAKDAWRQATLRRTVIASAFGLPSCVLPQPGLPPVGLALIAAPGADHALLDAAVHTARQGVGS